MYRGSTPTLTFTLPFSTVDIDNAYVTFAQYGTVKIDKPLTACGCDGNKLTVKLTQEETLSLRVRMFCGNAGECPYWGECHEVSNHNHHGRANFERDGD